jgi:hypothetical protein
MATQTFDDLSHDHTGARWLASAAIPIALLLLMGFLTLLQPYL